ncbi:MAG TPA: DUF4390 domain-containing protein [Thermoanaerobaculia bacterium]|nr:DUF4390 domain-containing protein [Thermoanaerobaculia bacterium]
MRVLALSLLILLLAGGAAAADAKIQNLVATAAEGEVSVRFGMANAFADEQRVQALQSGLATSITYIVEIYRDRPNWFDEGIQRSRIEVVATFNSVTREYLLNYRRDERLVRSETFTDLQALLKRMTTIDEPSLFTIGDRRPYKLKVRVKADLGRGWLLYIIPWQSSTRWRVARVTVPALKAEPKP